MTTSAIAAPKKGAVPPQRPAKTSADIKRRKSMARATLPETERLVVTITGVNRDDPAAVLERVRAGLPSSAIETLAEAYGASQAEIAQCLLIPLSTLRRRLKKAEHLEVDESDRVVRLARIKDLALDMMRGDNERAVAWLRTPRDILAGEAPMTHANTEIGAREVEDLIGRIRHGVFS